MRADPDKNVAGRRRRLRGRPRPHGWLVAGTLLATGLSPATALAFCRTTTCDPRLESCEYDEAGCNITGKPLFWDSSCVRFWVERDGSPRRDISHDEALDVIDRAFQTWEEAVCDGGENPFIVVTPQPEPAKSSLPEFDLAPGNQNVWIFRDDVWPHQGIGHALALSSVTFDADTGRILDVDVEVNSAQFRITTSEQGADADLESIATHEGGHFLGLDHTQVPTATMYANYSPGNLDFRSLEPDDEAGICAIYPPDTPRACVDDPLAPKKSSKGGCAMSASPGGRASTSAFFLCLLAGALLGRRRAKLR